MVGVIEKGGLILPVRRDTCKQTGQWHELTATGPFICGQHWKPMHLCHEDATRQVHAVRTHRTGMLNYHDILGLGGRPWRLYRDTGEYIARKKRAMYNYLFVPAS